MNGVVAVWGSVVSVAAVAAGAALGGVVVYRATRRRQARRWDTVDDGASAVEYGLLITAVTVVLAAGTVVLAATIHQLFEDATSRARACTVGPAAACTPAGR